MLGLIGYFVNVDLNFEAAIFPSSEKFTIFTVNRMSPFTGGLSCLTGAALLLLIRRSGKESVPRLAGTLGIAIALTGLTGIVGYVYGSPLLYTGAMIPMALPTNAAFMLLIALLALAILGIILILRNVKSACRILGVVFLLFGALEYAVVLIVKNVGPSVIARLNIQPALSNVPGIVLNDFMAPLQFVSLACLIAGGIIIVTSIVYPGVNPAKNAKGEIGPTAKESMVDSQL
jgi:hypothetical protein